MNEITVEICVGTPCHLMGAPDLMEMIQELPDSYQQYFRFKSAHCIEEKCHQAPVVKIGDKVLGNMTPEKLKKELDKKFNSSER